MAYLAPPHNTIKINDFISVFLSVCLIVDIYLFVCKIVCLSVTLSLFLFQVCQLLRSCGQLVLVALKYGSYNIFPNTKTCKSAQNFNIFTNIESIFDKF